MSYYLANSVGSTATSLLPLSPSVGLEWCVVVWQCEGANPTSGWEVVEQPQNAHGFH